MEWREENGVRWLQATMDGAKAVFSTRLGGVSAAPFDQLNLGLLTDDAGEAVAENRGRLARALGLAPARVPIARQVHGAELVHHEAPQEPSPFAAPGSPLPEADGHVVAAPGLAPLVFVADCLPVALRGPRGVAVLHCGWRPLAAGILARGAAAVAATEAAIGPGVGPCCYEVGAEVLDAFAGLGRGISVAGPAGAGSHRRLDLPEVARRQLRRAGVERIESADLCTACNPELFFSHRRDRGRTGRQAGLAWLTAADDAPGAG